MSQLLSNADRVVQAFLPEGIRYAKVATGRVLPGDEVTWTAGLDNATYSTPEDAERLRQRMGRGSVMQVVAHHGKPWTLRVVVPGAATVAARDFLPSELEQAIQICVQAGLTVSAGAHRVHERDGRFVYDDKAIAPEGEVVFHSPELAVDAFLMDVRNDR